MKTVKTFVPAILFLSVLTVISGLGQPARAELTPAGQREVAHLLGFLEKSSCEFNRNGTWYRDMSAVRTHAEQKQDYFAKKGKINSAEDFIAWAASKSEMSGKPYTVKCGEGPVQTTSRWLNDELARFRTDGKAMAKNEQPRSSGAPAK
jgi:hypothetical protein